MCVVFSMISDPRGGARGCRAAEEDHACVETGATEAADLGSGFGLPERKYGEEEANKGQGEGEGEGWGC
ncbi:ACC deaminase [Corchorus capsularis]|uniref:ACC deaminase n=1 Tax=Corchorus capsularis TaxID=210143 RepID=A0A1R3IJ74_COCAP|nr:ACC deaminase [Corchorus capsularis]